MSVLDASSEAATMPPPSLRMASPDSEVAAKTPGSPAFTEGPTVDADGNVCAITFEHASQRTDVRHLIVEGIAA